MTAAEHSASEKVPPENATKSDATSYVVLAQHTKADALNEATAAGTVPGLWRHVGEYDARSAKVAVRKYAATASDPSKGALVLVAVPARSWQPVKVTPKVETTLLIEGVS